MRVQTFPDGDSLARAAASEAASRIRGAIAASGRARIIAATGTSQMAFLDALTQAPDLDWSKVEMFHLDEYIGLPVDHPAAFRRYLLERLIRPTGIARAHLIDGERNPLDVCRELGREVPDRAITMSIRQILKSRAILAVVPEARKAPAVRMSLEGAISPMVPASILRTHAD